MSLKTSETCRLTTCRLSLDHVWRVVPASFVIDTAFVRQTTLQDHHHRTRCLHSSWSAFGLHWSYHRRLLPRRAVQRQLSAHEHLCTSSMGTTSSLGGPLLCRHPTLGVHRLKRRLGCLPSRAECMLQPQTLACERANGHLSFRPHCRLSPAPTDSTLVQVFLTSIL